MQIRSKYAFETAHRQYGDTSKCGFLHGHNWIAEVIIDGFVNHLGYVVDFKDVKEIINEMDHTVLLCEQDPLVEVLKSEGQRVFTFQKNPTCENLAEYITHRIIRMEGSINKVTVIVWENDKSWAKFSKSVR